MTALVRSGTQRPLTIHRAECRMVPRAGRVEPWPHPGIPEDAVTAHIAATTGLRGCAVCMHADTHKAYRRPRGTA